MDAMIQTSWFKKMADENAISIIQCGQNVNQHSSNYSINMAEAYGEF